MKIIKRNKKRLPGTKKPIHFSHDENLYVINRMAETHKSYNLIVREAIQRDIWNQHKQKELEADIIKKLEHIKKELNQAGIYPGKVGVKFIEEPK